MIFYGRVKLKLKIQLTKEPKKDKKKWGSKLKNNKEKGWFEKNNQMKKVLKKIITIKEHKGQKQKKTVVKKNNKQIAT